MIPRYGPRSRTKLQSIPTGNSAVVSHIESEHTKEYGSPMTGITVSQGVDVRIDRDDISQKSFTSTSNLTALPLRSPAKDTSWTTPKEWSQMPDDQHTKDIERGI